MVLAGSSFVLVLFCSVLCCHSIHVCHPRLGGARPPDLSFSCGVTHGEVVSTFSIAQDLESARNTTCKAAKTQLQGPA